MRASPTRLAREYQMCIRTDMDIRSDYIVSGLSEIMLLYRRGQRPAANKLGPMSGLQIGRATQAEQHKLEISS